MGQRAFVRLAVLEAEVPDWFEAKLPGFFNYLTGVHVELWLGRPKPAHFYQDVKWQSFAHDHDDVPNVS